MSESMDEKFTEEEMTPSGAVGEGFTVQGGQFTPWPLSVCMKRLVMFYSSCYSCFTSGNLS